MSEPSRKRSNTAHATEAANTRRYLVREQQAEIDRLRNQIKTLAAREERLRDLDRINFDLSRKLNIRIAENNILRTVIAELRQSDPAPILLAQNAPLPLPLGSFPDAATTGVEPGVVLTPFSGDIVDDAVIEGKSFARRLIIKANRVTIRNCLFDFADGIWLLDADGYNQLTVERCTFKGHGSINALLTGMDGRVIDCDISGVTNGITLQGGSALVEGNFIHDLDGDWVNDEPHIDGVSVQGTLSNVVIRNNTIVSWDTSGVFIKPEWGPISDVLIENNLIRRQPGKSYAYAIYSDEGPGGIPDRVTIRGNVIERGTWGFFSFRDPSRVAVSGNMTLDGHHIGPQ